MVELGLAFTISFLINLTLGWIIVRLLGENSKLKSKLTEIAKMTKQYLPPEPKKPAELPKEKRRGLIWRIKDM